MRQNLDFWNGKYIFLEREIDLYGMENRFFWMENRYFWKWKSQSPRGTYLEEVEEWDVLLELSQVFLVFEEEHVGQSGIDEVRVAMG